MVDLVLPQNKEEINMGITCKPMGKMRGMLRKIANENEKERSEKVKQDKNTKKHS